MTGAKRVGMSRIGLRALVCGFAAAMAANWAHAQQWMVINLHPPGAMWSSAVGVDGPRVVGSCNIGGETLPSLWMGTSNDPVNLKPAGIFGGEVAAAGGGQQVGYLDRNDTIPRRYRPRAVLWSGSAESFVDLQSPVGTAGTRAFGVGGGQQVGLSLFGILGTPVGMASLWSGTTESFVNLHDAQRMFGSVAYATDGTQQVGLFNKPLSDLSPGNTRAALWTGSAESLVNLHPSGVTDSIAVAVWGGQQVGTVFPDDSNNFYASLWTGTAASWVNLNPAGASASEAVGVAGGMQVGWAIFDDGTGMDTGVVYASLWRGTAASWVNLSAFLPPGYGFAQATGIWTDGTTTRISGYAANLSTGLSEAILWTRTTCCRADFNCSAGADAGVTVQDVFDFLTAWFAGDPRADFNGVGSITVQDIFDFLSSWFAGCP